MPIENIPKSSWIFTLLLEELIVNISFCNDIVVKYPNLIFDSSDFTSLQESALVSLLKRDDLQMKENSTLPIDLGDWTKENFLTLKTTLQHCLPHIRYFHFTNIEIYYRIRPYQKILDIQLWEDINQHIWIDCKTATYSTKSITCKFELILHGNRDLAPQKFWKICHGHACTIVVAKVKGIDEIIEGYNPLTRDDSNIEF
ncbi:hypothetical protein Glove_33g132 [Diversispora epigaea]|uniref:BACK domain-containing protein n=1 Tax=Diversispora epigaea TaxID=1348612 RepID=A0A397JJX3_9GLOM|nr:hypothetical protein Glove_33g132 [Diversispora epigaea]